MATYEFGGKTYDIPDNASMDQVQEFIKGQGGLQDQPSVGSRALKNLPVSAMNFVKGAFPPSMAQDAGTPANPNPLADPRKSTSFDPLGRLGDLAGDIASPFKKMGDIVMHPEESFANDPVGTIGYPAMLAKGAMTPGARAVMGGAAKGGFEGAKAPGLAKYSLPVDIGGYLMGGRTGAEIAQGLALAPNVISGVKGAVKGGMQAYRDFKGPGPNPAANIDYSNIPGMGSSVPAGVGFPEEPPEGVTGAPIPRKRNVTGPYSGAPAPKGEAPPKPVPIPTKRNVTGPNRADMQQETGSVTGAPIPKNRLVSNPLYQDQGEVPEEPVDNAPGPVTASKASTPAENTGTKNTIPEGLPAHYQDTANAYGNKIAESAHLKDMAVIEHLKANGHSIDDFANAPVEQRNQWLAEAGKSAGKQFVPYNAGPQGENSATRLLKTWKILP